MSAHALLSASSSNMWLHCPPSARLQEQFPDTTSDYAKEGTLAHAIAELKLRKYIAPMGPRKYSAAIKKLQEEPLYDPEMMHHTEAYLDYIKEVMHAYGVPPHVAVEKRLDYSHIAPGGFGTGDCIVIGGDALHVIDFKYGKGVPVSAEHNSQMMLYALGALNEYGLVYSIQTIKLAIVQPRLNNNSVWELYADDLENWAAEIKPIADMAYEGEGEYDAGEWCRFCRARAVCRARGENMTALEAFGAKPPALLTYEEIGGLLGRAKVLRDWVKDVEEYALSALLQGEDIPDWKAVEGRSVRQFADIDRAFRQLIDNGYQEEMLYKREPATLTEIEKLLGKKLFETMLSDYVIKPPGKPALAPASDKREAITTKLSAAEAFGTQQAS